MYPSTIQTSPVPFFACLFFTLVLALASAGAFAEPVTVDIAQGTVEYRHDSEGAWQAVTAGDSLPIPVEIRTGPNTSAQVRQAGTFFDVSADTHIRLSNEDDQADGLVSRVKQWIGTVFYDVERQPDTFQVETPFLVSTVKGTQFTIVTTDSASFVTLKEGRLEVVDRETGNTRTLNPGDIASVSSLQAEISSLLQTPDALPATEQQQALDIARVDVRFGQSEQGDTQLVAQIASSLGLQSELGLTAGLGGLGIDASADLASDLGADLVADLGNELGTDVGSMLGGDLSLDLGLDLVADIGSDIGAEIGADLGAEIGAEIGADLGLDLDLDDDLGGDLGDDLGDDLGQAVGGIGGSVNNLLN